MHLHASPSDIQLCYFNTWRNYIILLFLKKYASPDQLGSINANDIRDKWRQSSFTNKTFP